MALGPTQPPEQRGLGHSLGYSGWSMALTTDLYSIKVDKTVELYLYSPLCLHGISYSELPYLTLQAILQVF
jgi:hypothetical protein